ncbi:hypothetical protein [Polyangium mundeleinium]|uniref:ATP-binding protein n=1 Tax=Polyangium mundeleinium TaxID=2995306 RepID=A0ABT5ENB2_9BACT|nr:hypothetical protein [Polyangium mundeleinium]MDC0742668.1 hypothetical protein [Polyangium mundeleinium]
MIEPARSSVFPRALAARLVSVTIGDYQAIGSSTIELSIAPRRTVLVAKGGTLASLLVQGIAEGAHIAVHALSDPEKPRHFRCEFEGDAGEHLVYGYDRRFQDLDDDDEPFPPSMRWEEHAARTDEANVDLWTVRDRRAVFGDGSRISLPSGVGALALAGDSADRVPEDARRIRAYLEGIRWLGLALARPPFEDRTGVTLTGRSGVLWTSRGLDARLLSLASTLVLWFDLHRDRYNKVVELCQRIGAPGELAVQITRDTSARADVAPQDRASITFEGVDFGRLSDAVIRRLELLVALVDPEATALLIEEPEIAAVPGNIVALLDVIEACADHRQLIISTKSPHVIDWARPDELRFVEKNRHRDLSVRGLDFSELGAAQAHVAAGGKLSAFLAS